MLVAARTRLELEHPAHLVRVQTFGSPPVLTQQPAGRASSVLQVFVGRKIGRCKRRFLA